MLMQTVAELTADFHDDQIALGNSGQQIGKSRDTKITDSIFNQHTFIGEDQHKISSCKYTGQKEYSRYQTA